MNLTSRLECANWRPLAGMAILLVCTWLTSCAQPGSTGANAVSSKHGCSQALNPTDNTKLAGIEQLVREGKFYAALAQLDALGASTPEAELVRAEALRKIDKTAQAQAIYQSLVGSCLDGQAQHGLGLIAASRGQLSESIRYLQGARQALPTDPRVRNDLGYSLLLHGDLEAAQFEFLTVLDLNPQDSRAMHNLILLTFLQGQDDKARDLAHKMGLGGAQVDRLAQQARMLIGTRNPSQPAALPANPPRP